MTSASPRIVPRSLAISRSWVNFDFASFFSAILYPALGIATIASAFTVGYVVYDGAMAWWYAPLALAVTALTIFLCNLGIGGLHRIWQHKAGELKVPAAAFVMFNCLLAMQGKLQDWVNYHSQHHRFADGPGDPHNPAEGIVWAWFGWILWRDPKDGERPLAAWLRDNPVVRFADRFHITLSLLIHLAAPAVIYLAVWYFGGSLILTAILHAAAIIGRGIQFHATVLGINVFGHMRVPVWFTYFMALLTGGEAFHAHHHDFPKSALHLPRRGIINRVFDYNGTMLLVFRRLGLAKDFEIAPQFA